MAPEVEGKEDEAMVPHEEEMVGLEDSCAECKEVGGRDGGKHIFVGT